MTNGKTRLVIPRHNPINAVCETATGKEIFFAAPFPFALFFDLLRGLRAKKFLSFPLLNCPRILQPDGDGKGLKTTWNAAFIFLW
jgi:hypothetical protein